MKKEELFIKYFNRTITEEELATLFEWVEESTENKQELFLMYRTWNLIEFEKQKADIDLVKELDKFRKKISSEKKNNRKRNIMLFTAVAASALLCLLMLNKGFFLEWNKKNQDIANFADLNKPETFFLQETRLILSDSDSIAIDSENADIKYDNENITVDEKKIASRSGSSSFNQLLVPFGRRSSIVFSDGTKVWVNAGSRLIYPIEFDSEKREIFVEGEIYIDVANDTDRPFVVKTKNLEVEVLGTRFNVAAYESETTSNIVLVSGKVSVANIQTRDKTEMTPGKMYAYNKNDGKSVISTVNPYKYTSWIEGVYLFDREPFGKITERLSRYYGVNIECDAKIGRFLCSGKLDFKEDIESILDGLSISIPMTYTYTDTSYRIKVLE